MTESYKKFVELVADQFTYGGKKYALTTTKESTDMLFDIHGYKWLVGTIHKYVYRYGNLARERDLLKIACYMYILWLKRGFHLSSIGTDIPIDTTVDVKSEFFKKFLETVEHTGGLKTVPLNKLDRLGSILINWSKTDDWYGVDENEIIEVFILSFLTWEDAYSAVAVHDTDTNNK